MMTRMSSKKSKTSLPKEGDAICPHFTSGLQKPDEVFQSVRETPPTHCVLKIESFSTFSDIVTTTRHQPYFVSPIFRAAGHDWLLYIYPKGDMEDGGDGHISIYTEMMEETDYNLSVNVMLKYFVYDHIRNNYLVVHTEKCFDYRNQSNGVSKLIPQDAFCDPTNGFLVNDRCVFGIEIYALEHCRTKFATWLSMHKPKAPTYTWIVNDFSELHGTIHSSSFTTEGCTWKLVLMFGGYLREKSGDGTGISLSLLMLADDTVGLSEEGFMEFEIRLEESAQ